MTYIWEKFIFPLETAVLVTSFLANFPYSDSSHSSSFSLKIVQGCSWFFSRMNSTRLKLICYLLHSSGDCYSSSLCYPLCDSIQLTYSVFMEGEKTKLLNLLNCLQLQNFSVFRSLQSQNWELCFLFGKLISSKVFLRSGCFCEVGI